jgi:hypothetical protein
MFVTFLELRSALGNTYYSETTPIRRTCRVQNVENSLSLIDFAEPGSTHTAKGMLRSWGDRLGVYLRTGPHASEQIDSITLFAAPFEGDGHEVPEFFHMKMAAQFCQIDFHIKKSERDSDARPVREIQDLDRREVESPVSLDGSRCRSVSLWRPQCSAWDPRIDHHAISGHVPLVSRFAAIINNINGHPSGPGLTLACWDSTPPWFAELFQAGEMFRIIYPMDRTDLVMILNLASVWRICRCACT